MHPREFSLSAVLGMDIEKNERIKNVLQSSHFDDCILIYHGELKRNFHMLRKLTELLPQVSSSIHKASNTKLRGVEI
jgi:hypothetical protein